MCRIYLTVIRLLFAKCCVIYVNDMMLNERAIGKKWDSLEKSCYNKEQSYIICNLATST